MRPLIIANWKMNPQTQREAKKLFSSDVIICPPFCYLHLGGGGAQDCFYEEKGAYTGEVSPLMLKDLKVKYVLTGHSERRALGETDEIVNKKMRALLKIGLTPVLCVGEKKKGEGFSVVRDQIKEAFKDVPKVKIEKVVIAYEPVWAIGTGSACSPDDALTMILFIRKFISQTYGKKNMKVLYGGSVNSSNAKKYLSEWINGLLVGNASLDRKEFTKLLQSI